MGLLFFFVRFRAGWSGGVFLSCGKVTIFLCAGQQNALGFRRKGAAFLPVAGLCGIFLSAFLLKYLAVTL
jgi:hypothetical protein